MPGLCDPLQDRKGAKLAGRRILIESALMLERLARRIKLQMG
jgi:hypothetical protein